jgi:GPH family glycoside/pentoside/hexuronide:cation symporter
MWTFTSKIGQSLAIVLTGGILQLARYVPNAAEQAESARLTIRLLIGPIPAVVLLGAMLLIQFYPLDEKTYNDLIAGKKE